MNMANNKLLYKYYPPVDYVINALKDETICFTDICSQNDPFEGMGFYRVIPNNESQEAIVSNQQQELLAKYITEEERGNLQKWYRIFCATTEWKRPLMWAHYAKAHQGVCIGYTLHDIKLHCTKLRPVQYNDMPLEKDFSYLDLTKFLFFKAKDWAYEKEYRGIYKLKSEDYFRVPKLEKDKSSIHLLRHTDDDMYFYIPGFKIQAKRRILKKCRPQEITMGLYTPKEYEEVLQAVSITKRIPLYKAKMKDHSFEIDRTPIYIP